MGPPLVSLREITAGTVREVCALQTTEMQKSYVAPNAVSIAQAYFEPSGRFRAIYAGEEPVGFVMWRPVDEETCYVWRFMIDSRFQGRGYGRSGLEQLLESLAGRGIRCVKLSCVVGGGASPRGFYLRLGFRDVHEVAPNGEQAMQLSLL
jgi:diamine N-acetyltransferase